MVERVDSDGLKGGTRQAAAERKLDSRAGGGMGELKRGRDRREE